MFGSVTSLLLHSPIQYCSSLLTWVIHLGTLLKYVISSYFLLQFRKIFFHPLTSSQHLQHSFFLLTQSPYFIAIRYNKYDNWFCCCNSYLFLFATTSLASRFPCNCISFRSPSPRLFCSQPDNCFDFSTSRCLS